MILKKKKKKRIFFAQYLVNHKINMDIFLAYKSLICLALVLLVGVDREKNLNLKTPRYFLYLLSADQGSPGSLWLTCSTLRKKAALISRPVVLLSRYSTHHSTSADTCATALSPFFSQPALSIQIALE